MKVKNFVRTSCIFEIHCCYYQYLLPHFYEYLVSHFFSICCLTACFFWQNFSSVDPPGRKKTVSSLWRAPIKLIWISSLLLVVVCHLSNVRQICVKCFSNFRQMLFIIVFSQFYLVVSLSFVLYHLLFVYCYSSFVVFICHL